MLVYLFWEEGYKSSSLSDCSRNHAQLKYDRGTLTEFLLIKSRLIITSSTNTIFIGFLAGLCRCTKHLLQNRISKNRCKVTRTACFILQQHLINMLIACTTCAFSLSNSVWCKLLKFLLFQLQSTQFTFYRKKKHRIKRL